MAMTPLKKKAWISGGVGTAVLLFIGIKTALVAVPATFLYLVVRDIKRGRLQ